MIFFGHIDLHRKNFIVYFLCQITETISTKYLSRIMILKICFCTLDSITLERDDTCKKRIFFLGEYIVRDNKQQCTKETRLQHELHYSKRQETLYWIVISFNFYIEFTIPMSYESSFERFFSPLLEKHPVLRAEFHSKISLQNLGILHFHPWEWYWKRQVPYQPTVSHNEG